VFGGTSGVCWRVCLPGFCDGPDPNSDADAHADAYTHSLANAGDRQTKDDRQHIDSDHDDNVDGTSHNDNIDGAGHNDDIDGADDVSDSGDARD
jgi:hypothetical protein